MDVKQKTLSQLFFPICAETQLYMLAGMVDTLMLSTLGDQAVGAVGTANTYISMFILMFSIVSSGMMAVVTQNIGAGNMGTAVQSKNIGMICNLILGVILSAFLGFGARGLLNTVGISAALEEYAVTYIQIVGSACVLNALIPVFSGYLRAFGHTKYPLWATTIGNMVNIALNSLFLFYFHYGIAGVAVATVISKVVNLLLVMGFSVKLIRVPEANDRGQPRKILGNILRVGFPSAVETILYNISITLAIRFLNQMDSQGFQVAARAYASQIATFSFGTSAALAQANAILTGWRVGKKEYDVCNRETRKALYMGLAVSITLATLIALSSPVLVRLFTKDPEMIRVVCRLLWIDIVLELGRTTNLIYGNALKTCGDALFPVVIGVIFMFLCTVGGTWYLGIHKNLLVTGCYIALTADECTRAVAMILRWQSGKWKSKGLV